jgi:hypothetical protein
MRSIVPSKLEDGRIRHGRMGSDASYGTTGAFRLIGPIGTELMIVSSDGEGWEHVSVSCERRTPNWREMCFVKDLFWTDEECVMQLHPPKRDYVNCHPNCLHLWRPIGRDIPQPDAILVGPK